MNKLKHHQKTISFIVVFLLLILIPFGIIYNNWNHNLRQLINPGVKINNISLSGLSIDQAETIINNEADRLESAGIPISYGNQQIILPSLISASTDLTFPVFMYNRDEALKQLTDYSPQNSFLTYLKSSVRSLFSSYDINLNYSFDKDRAKNFILENLKNVDIEPRNATFKVNKNIDYTVSFFIEPEQIGRKIDFDRAFADIEEHLQFLSNKPVILRTATARPTVSVSDLESLKPEAEALIAQGDLKLTASTTATSTWVVKKDTLASWITSENVNNSFKLSLDTTRISEYLKDNIAPQINREPMNPRYEIKDGKMSSWQVGADGKKLNLESSAEQIKNQYLLQKNNQAELIVDTIANQLPENNGALDIQEIIGTGHSNFSGSPANRLHNIQVGADALNGLLIAPGEEFSLVKALGEIDASSGYLQELVIKDNKTIPEYGGGLCQIATTVFRSALASGLPITARQNHSYRVVYYEPAGTDAAVYDPWPDMRFLNDSDNYILIQSRIVKNDIYFDFWGKKDGRIASSTTPVVYNITKPAPAKITETTDLKPGETKCTESAHNGADAYFDYTVTYASGDIKSTRFKSHYVPWQKVCLVGATTTPDVATSTPAN